MRSLHTKTGGQPPLAATRESLCAAMNTQHSQKQIKVKKKKKKTQVAVTRGRDSGIPSSTTKWPWDTFLTLSLILICIWGLQGYSED